MEEKRYVNQIQFLKFFSEIKYDRTERKDERSDGSIVTTIVDTPRLPKPIIDVDGFQVYEEGKWFIWDSPIWTGKMKLDKTGHCPEWLVEMIKER